MKYLKEIILNKRNKVINIDFKNIINNSNVEQFFLIRLMESG